MASDYPSYFNNAFSFWKSLNSNKPTQPSLQPRSSSNASKLRQVSSLSLTSCCREASDAVLSCADTSTETFDDASRSDACLVEAAASHGSTTSLDPMTSDPTSSDPSMPDRETTDLVASVPAVTSETTTAGQLTSETVTSEPVASEPVTPPPAEVSPTAKAAGLAKAAATRSVHHASLLLPSRIPKPSGQRTIVKSRAEGTTLIPRPAGAAAAEKQVRRRSSNGAKQLEGRSDAIPAAPVKKLRAVSSSKVALVASSRRPWRP